MFTGYRVWPFRMVFYGLLKGRVRTPTVTGTPLPCTWREHPFYRMFYISSAETTSLCQANGVYGHVYGYVYGYTGIRACIRVCIRVCGICLRAASVSVRYQSPCGSSLRAASVSVYSVRHQCQCFHAVSVLPSVLPCFYRFPVYTVLHRFMHVYT